MKNTQLIIAAFCIKSIADETGAAIIEIIDELTGVCFNEEEAGQIKEFISNEDDV
jgi:hypothetical protein